MKLKAYHLLSLLVLAALVLAACASPGAESTEAFPGTGNETSAVMETPVMAATTAAVEVTSAPATTAAPVATTAAPAATSAVTSAATSVATSAATTAPAVTAGASTTAAAACTDLPGTEAEFLTAGQTTYNTVCAACHGPNGEGTGNFPALANNPDVITTDATAMVSAFMQAQLHAAFLSTMQDADVAAVLSYVRNQLGPDASIVCPADVTAAR